MSYLRNDSLRISDIILRFSQKIAGIQIRFIIVTFQKLDVSHLHLVHRYFFRHRHSSISAYQRPLDGTGSLFSKKSPPALPPPQKKNRNKNKKEKKETKSCIYIHCVCVYTSSGVACVLIWCKHIASRNVANRAEIERNRTTGGENRPDSVGELDRRVVCWPLYTHKPTYLKIPFL